MKFELPLCPRCQQYRLQFSDRYCGLCGNALASLHFIGDEGETVILKDASEGARTVSLELINSGSCNLDIHFEGSEFIKVSCKESLRPHETVTAEFTISSEVINLERPSLIIPFTTNALNYCDGRGEVRVLLELPESESDSLFIGKEGLSKQDDYAYLLELGDIFIRSEGDTSHCRKVVYKNGSFKNHVLKLNNDSGLVLFALQASEIIAPAMRETELVLNFVVNRKSDFPCSFTIQANNEPYNFRVEGRTVTSAIFHTEEVRFPATVKKQNSHAVARIENRGGCKFVVKRIIPQGGFVQPLRKEFNMVLEPSGKIEVELLFSTRCLEPPPVLDDEQKILHGRLLVETDLPVPCYIYWQVSIQEIISRGGIIAIDFGTINSCVAYFDNSLPRPHIIREKTASTVESGSSNAGIIPSLLAFLDKDAFLIGEKAMEVSKLKPENIVHSVKRCILEGERTICGKKYTPKELATFLMEQILLKAAQLENKIPDQIVLTLPANFWGTQRKILEEACEKACSDWKMIRKPSTIDEPTAAAMYYILKNQQHYQKLSGCENLLVFDFGGGTFDVSIVKVEANEKGIVIEPLISRGDNCLGGIDLDLAVLRKTVEISRPHPEGFADKIVTENKESFQKRLVSMDVTQKSEWYSTRFEWIDNAQTTKKSLSANEEYECMYPFKAKGSENRQKVRFNRENLESAVQDRIERAFYLLDSVLTAVHLRAPDIQRVLLTGQSCLLHGIYEKVRSRFPSATAIVDPREQPEELKTCVALGAAIAESFRSRGAASFTLKYLEKTSYRYGYPKLIGLGNRFIEVIPLGESLSEAGKPHCFVIDDISDGISELPILQSLECAGDGDTLAEFPCRSVDLVGTVEFLPLRPFIKDGRLELEMSLTPDGEVVIMHKQTRVDLKTSTRYDDSTYI